MSWLNLIWFDSLTVTHSLCDDTPGRSGILTSESSTKICSAKKKSSPQIAVVNLLVSVISFVARNARVGFMFCRRVWVSCFV